MERGRMKSPWFSPDSKKLINLNRYQKIEVFYPPPYSGRCHISGLPFGTEDQWEDLVKGEKPDIKRQWETIKEILLS